MWFTDSAGTTGTTADAIEGLHIAVTSGTIGLEYPESVTYAVGGTGIAACTGEGSRTTWPTKGTGRVAGKGPILVVAPASVAANGTGAGSGIGLEGSGAGNIGERSVLGQMDLNRQWRNTEVRSTVIFGVQ